MSTVRANNILDAAGGNTATINGMTPTAQSLQGFRNRIINGDMRIDQRNAGASISLLSASGYAVDRWHTVAFGGAAGGFSAQRVTDAPAGFTNSLRITTTTADASITAADNYQLIHNIEGFNTADLGFGTASATSVTLSFWIKSSLTGTQSGSLINGPDNRSYVFTFTVSSANTWEYKSITIAGDTAGTWNTDNSTGISVRFNLGGGSNFQGTSGSWAAASRYAATGAVQLVGTLNATLQLTGVQLEAGSVATPFERRDYGRELMMCQRYYQRLVSMTGHTNSTANGGWRVTSPLVVPMRATPTLSLVGTPTFLVAAAAGGITLSAITSQQATPTIAQMDCSWGSTVSGTNGFPCTIEANDSRWVAANSEL